MNPKYRIVIVEDHTILREELKFLLASDPQYEVVGEAEDGRETMRIVEKLKPDLVLTDLSMPRMNGMEAIREIKKISPTSKVLVLTVHKAEEYVSGTFQAVADGYLLKDSTRVELMTAVQKALSGKRYITPEISEKVIEGYLEGRVGIKPRTSWETLQNDTNWSQIPFYFSIFFSHFVSSKLLSKMLVIPHLTLDLLNACLQA